MALIDPILPPFTRILFTFFLLLHKGSCKKKLFFGGPTTKRGEGVRARTLRKKELLFEHFFLFMGGGKNSDIKTYIHPCQHQPILKKIIFQVIIKKSFIKMGENVTVPFGMGIYELRNFLVFIFSHKICMG